ncbi:MAG: hypothetical protein LBC73_05975 [Oscillospiraceae bacterium]|jgi:hypothetical protein|nr:hypothetical protein [Oscillospiraceae bacterium]
MKNALCIVFALLLALALSLSNSTQVNNYDDLPENEIVPLYIDNPSEGERK